MKQFRTRAIILSRTDYGEADRIIGFITPDHGKVKAIAKGVRKSRSKLAGGIELFSVSDVSFIPGRKEISTVVSTRLIKHYGDIVKDLGRTNLAFAIIKRLDKATEESPEPDYFHLLENAFMVLDAARIDNALIELWFDMQLLRLAGHTPNLRTDDKDKRLQPDKKYSFDLEHMRFYEVAKGEFVADHIKFLRLGFSSNTAQTLSRVSQSAEMVDSLRPIVQPMLQTHIRV